MHVFSHAIKAIAARRALPVLCVVVRMAWAKRSPAALLKEEKC
jgi:hypothetical protein